jgi:soluble lytic murein transglycosylase-like protein
MSQSPLAAVAVFIAAFRCSFQSSLHPFSFVGRKSSMTVFAIAMALAIVSTPASARNAHHQKHAKQHARGVVMDARPFAAPWMAPQEARMKRRERRAMATQQTQAFGMRPFVAQAFGASFEQPGYRQFARPPRAREATPRQDAYAEMVQRHAAANGIPASLVHRVIMRESRYNPRAVSKGNYGMMQIRLGTARAMGYTGAAAGLLDPEVNMTYAVKYLAGAYKVAGGSESGAVSNYARGYYYQARR